MKFTNRWQHKMTLTLRVWPRETRAHKLSVMGTEWSVDGMTFNANERLEVVHRLGEKGFAAWELSVEDAETLMAVGSSGAKLGAMRVRCPGSMVETAKKACWLDAEVTVYPEASDRMYSAATRITREVVCPWEDLAETLRSKWAGHDEIARRHEAKNRSKARYESWLAGFEPRTFGGFVVYGRVAKIDVAAVANHILAGKVVVFKSNLVEASVVAKLRECLNYYTVDGRRPDEEGGLFRGYQLGDGVIRWRRSVRPEDRPADVQAHMEAMHQVLRAKGQANRRTYFVQAVTDRIARQYGISEQRVMSGFLRYGIVDYLIRSYEAAAASGKVKIHSDPGTDLRGFITKAVRVVSFIVDGFSKEAV